MLSVPLGRRWLPVLLACLLAAVGVDAQQHGPIRQLLRDGKYDEAIAVGRKAVAKNPSDPELRMLLANALAAKGRRQTRVVVLTGTPEDATTSPQFRVQYDGVLLEEALLHVEESIRLAPRRKDLRLSHCFLLTDAGEIERATRAIRETIAAFPGDTALPAELAAHGAERTKRGDARGGAALLAVIVQAFPSNAEIQADYGFSCAKAGSKAEAVKALGRAAALAPKHPKIQRMRGQVGIFLRDFAMARSGYLAAFEIEGQQADRLGAAAAAYGLNPKTAVEELREMATPYASSDPAMVETARGFSDAAESRDGAVALELAKKLVGQKQQLLAIPLLDRLLREGSHDAAARSLLEQVYRELGNPELALEARAGSGAAKP